MVLELRTMIVYESGMEIARNVANRTFWDYEKVGVYICKNSSCYTFKIHLTVCKFHFNKKLKANNKNPCIKISGLNTLNVFKNYQTGFFEIQIKCCLKDTLTKTHEKTKKGCKQKHEKKIFHANTNSNKTSIYKLISDKAEERK